MSHARWRSFVALHRVKVPVGTKEKSLHVCAEAGNFLKECVLAQLLFDRADYDTAFKHFTHAAQGGSAAAVHNSAVMMELGLGTQKLVIDAIKLYRRAARDGIVEAKHRLGYHLALTGDDGCGGIAEGAILITEAAGAGLVEAMFDFGMMHLYNTALDESVSDVSVGLKWLTGAFEKGQFDDSKTDVAAEASFQMALYNYTTRNESVTDSEKLATKTIAAYKFAKTAAITGHALAQDFLGQLLVKGVGDNDITTTKDNFEEAAKWFGAAAKQGVVSAKRDLALLIDVGEVQADGEDMYNAALLYQEAADAGDVMAKFRLGICYGRGHLVERDTDRARDLLIDAAWDECVPAIAHVLSTKMTTEEDEVRMFKASLAKIAANKNHPFRGGALKALASLGLIASCHGCGTTKYELGTVQLSKCGKCKVALYCSRACQQSDWKEHRAECAAVIKSKEALAEVAAEEEEVPSNEIAREKKDNPSE